jgi:diguanylate cyclase (GGDEF)-like protein
LDIWDHKAFEMKKIELANSKISSLSMVMIDFDKFKNKNDTYGHEVGDIILKGVIKILKEECGDCIYRI